MDPYGLGRWSYMTLTGWGKKRIVIITAYKVYNTTAGSSGDCTTYMQQYRTILAHNNKHSITTTPQPQRQFILDLQAWVEMLQANGCSIILNLDANKDILSHDPMHCPLIYKDGTFIEAPHHNGHMATLLTTCGLIDSLSYTHPPPYPSTHARGKTRLDYILLSKDLAPALLRSGVLPLFSIFLSDHCPCYVDFDSTTLFSHKTHPIAIHTQ
jgi:exonuclease III